MSGLHSHYIVEVTPEHVRWAFRLLLDREPEETAIHAPFSDTWQLRHHFLNSGEYRQNNHVGHASGQTWVIYETRHNYRIYLTLEDLAIARNIMLGRYELSETEFVKNEIRAGDLVIDVGANIGYYTLLFGMLVAPHGRVVAFEPVPFLWDALTKSVQENRLQGICETYRAALSDSDEDSILRFPEYTVNFGGAFLVKDGSSTPPGGIDVRAETRTLDSYLDHSESCAFIKIDVEGAEPAVLRGAVHVLARDRPTIMCELHNAQLARVGGSDANQLIDWMSERGYACRTIEDGVRGVTLQTYDRDVPVNVVFDSINGTQ
jgi:FkbM family methyltransferase